MLGSFFILQRRNITRLSAVVLCICAILLNFCVPGASAASASTAETGWVEIKTAVPEDFNCDYLVLQAIHQGTGETVFLQILAENNYVLRTEIPTGHYVIDLVFVNEDFRYKVTSSVTEFEVTSLAAASIELTVEMYDQYKPAESEPVESPSGVVSTEPPSAAPSETPSASTSEDPAGPDPSESSSVPVPSDDAGENPDDSSSSAGKMILKGFFILLGTAVFCGMVFLIAYVVRSKIDSN